MGKKFSAILFSAFLSTVPWLVYDYSLAAEKLQVATPIKTPISFLPLLAVEEKGIGKDQGIELSWAHFKSAIGVFSAIASKRLDSSVIPLALVILAASRGIDIVVVADLDVYNDWSVYVRSDSPINRPEDLKGAKYGVSRLGALNHAYAQALTKALGLEKGAKYAALGGIPQIIAGLRTGVVDALVTTGTVTIKLELQGHVRKILPLSKVITLEDPYTIMVSRRLAKDKPAFTRAFVRTVLRGGTFARNNREWSIQKIAAQMGWGREVAEEFFRRYAAFSPEGTIRSSMFVNMRKLFLEYGLAKEEKTPSATEIYSGEFVPVR